MEKLAKKEYARKAFVKNKDGNEAWEAQAKKWIEAETKTEQANMISIEDLPRDEFADELFGEEKEALVTSQSQQQSHIHQQMIPAEALVSGDQAKLSVQHIVIKGEGEEDALTELFTGQNSTTQLQAQSAYVMKVLQKNIQVGDLLIPATSISPANVKFAHLMKAEILTLPFWPAGFSLKAGHSCTILPLREGLPTAAMIASQLSTTKRHLSTSALAQSLGITDRYLMQNGITCSVSKLLNILQKSSHNAAQKKITAITDPNSELITVELQLALPTLFEAITSIGPKLSSFLLFHQKQLLAVGVVTHVLQHGQHSFI